jgi:hypothetical protein
MYQIHKQQPIIPILLDFLYYKGPFSSDIIKKIRVPISKANQDVWGIRVPFNYILFAEQKGNSICPHKKRKDHKA